jgi:hypothetical protein
MGRPSGDLVLCPVLLFEDKTDAEVDDDPYTVTEAQLLKRSENSTVFRAKLYRYPQEGEEAEGPLDVVLKMDPTGKRAHDLYREAISYVTTVEKLQGTYRCAQILRRLLYKDPLDHDLLYRHTILR